MVDAIFKHLRLHIELSKIPTFWISPLKTPLKSIKNRIDIVSLYEGYKHIKKTKAGCNYNE